MRMVLFVMIGALMAGAAQAGAEALVMERNAVWVDAKFPDAKASAKTRAAVMNSAALFRLVMEKGSAVWWSESGKHLCIQPDGDGPVAGNMIKEAKAYGYSLALDEGRKICGSFSLPKAGQ